MEINWKELFNNKNNVFHCETEEIADKFLKIAHNLGYEWIVGYSFLEHNYWKNYGENTCYDLYNGQFCYLNHFLSEYRTIINVSELLIDRKQFKLKRK